VTPPAPRLPSGFDPRCDLLLDFGVDEQGQETMEFRGVESNGAAILPDRREGRVRARLPEPAQETLGRWLRAPDRRGRDDLRRLIVRQLDPRSTAAWAPWEELAPVRSGRIRLVRCLAGLRAPEPRRPGPTLEALLVIGDPRQGDSGDASVAVEVETGLRATIEALQSSGFGRITLAAPVGWSRLNANQFEPFEGREQLLAILRRGWDVVHFLSHGDPPEKFPPVAKDSDPLLLDAGSLRLEAEPDGLRFDELARALADGRTQLLTLQCCYGGPQMARLLLSVVPHLVLFRGAVSASSSSAFAQDLYSRLFQKRLPMDSAVAAARRAGERVFAAVPAHCTSDLARRVVREEHEYQREQYLARVRDHHSNRVVRMLGRLESNDHLQELFVELEVGPKSSEARDVRSAEVELGPYSLLELLALPPSTADDVSGCWFVVGDPGSGKSTGLRALACQLAAEGHFVPVLIDLSRWRDESGQLESLDTETIAAHNRCLRPPAAAVGQWALLLDGLDECPEDDETLKAILGSLPGQRVIVATRRLHYVGRRPAKFRPVFLRDLREEQRVELVTKRFEAHARQAPERWSTRRPAEEARALVAGLRGTLRRAGGNPFFLSLIALLRAEGDGPQSGASRHEVLDEALTRLIRGEHRNGREVERLRYLRSVPREQRWRALEAYEERARRLMQAVAFGSTNDRREPFDGSDLRRWVEGHEGDDPVAFLTDFVLPDSGLLIAGGDGDPSYAFAHRVLREALTGEHLIEAVWKPGGRTALEAFVRRELASDRPELVNEWGELLAQLTASLPREDVADWVRFLREHHSGLGLRVLAHAELDPRVAAEILSGTEDRDQRWQAYESLIGSEDPCYSLALVKALIASEGSSTTVPDLARLDDLLRPLGNREVADRELCTSIAHLRERLLDAARPPPLDHETSRAVYLELPTGAAARSKDRTLWTLDILPGCFELGSPTGEPGRFGAEGPVHVTLTQPFRMARVTVTRGQYRMFDQHKYEAGNDELPANSVTWYEACFYCRFLERVLRRLGDPTVEVRLPTEAEWEYACREAGAKATKRDLSGRVLSSFAYHSGNDEADLRRVGHFGGQQVQPVGRLEPNALGLYDLHGNVWEWCLDQWQEQPPEGRDPIGRSAGNTRTALRVWRGGSYWGGAGICRAACRHHWHPAGSSVGGGFRPVLGSRLSR
jgi:sulfatase modifying factor 1